MPIKYSKFINFFVSVLVVLTLSFSVFTNLAHAAVVNTYSIISNSRDILASITLPVPSSSSAVAASPLLKVGNALIDGVFYNDFTFDVSYQRVTNNNNGVLLNFNFRPMYAKYDNDVSVFDINEFAGHTVSLYLPQYLGSDLGYSSTYEWVPLTIGGNYGGSYSNLFLTQFKPDNYLQAFCWSSSDYTYHHFALDTSFARFTPSITGPYSNYTGLQLLTYVAQTMSSRLGTDRNIQARTSVAFDINYFPDVLSYSEKAQLEKLDDINSSLTQVDGTLNDIKDVLNQAPSVPVDPPPQYELPDTGEDKFLDDADKILDDLNNYKDSILNQFPDVNDNLFGASASVIRAFVSGSFDTFTYRIIDSSAGVDFSPVMTIIYLSFIIGIVALLRG